MSTTCRACALALVLVPCLCAGQDADAAPAGRAARDDRGRAAAAAKQPAEVMDRWMVGWWKRMCRLPRGCDAVRCVTEGALQQLQTRLWR
eukprot:31519-Pelagomonas_calceolata.AAC.3